MSGKLEELENLLAKKVERDEEWGLIEIEDVRPINISRIKESVKNLPKPAIILAILVKYFEKFNKEYVNITKLTKITFEIEKEVFEKVLSTNVFSFRGYNYGPFTKEIYDCLEFLQNLDLVELNEEKNKKEVILTQKGLEFFNTKVKDVIPNELFRMLEKVVEEYGALSYDELIRRVYTEHPEYAEKSLIRDRYLY